MGDKTGLSYFGAVSSVRGSVVDMRFDARLPSVYLVLRAGAEKQVVIEVLAQRDTPRVSEIALTPAQDLARGMAVVALSDCPARSAFSSLATIGQKRPMN